jgi:hypothetical protein
VVSYWSFEEPLSCITIPLSMKISINDFAILVHSPPRIMLFSAYFHEDFIDEEGVTIASVLSFRSHGIFWTELYTPKPDRLAAACNSSFSQQMLNIAITEIEAIMEPNSVTDYFGRESVSFVGINRSILSISES